MHQLLFILQMLLGRFHQLILPLLYRAFMAFILAGLEVIHCLKQPFMLAVNGINIYGDHYGLSRVSGITGLLHGEFAQLAGFTHGFHFFRAPCFNPGCLCCAGSCRSYGGSITLRIPQASLHL